MSHTPDAPSQGVVITHGEVFQEASHQLSDYLRGLRLSPEENNRLIRLIIDQVHAAEENAFRQGFAAGMKYGLSYPAPSKPE